MFSLFKPHVAESIYLRDEAKKLLEYTPDRQTLSQYELQLLFVYDQCQQGHYEWERIGPEAMFGATAFTAGKYAMWKKKMGLRTEAVAVSPSLQDKFNPVFDQRGAPAARIQGEIFAVRPEKIFELDLYKRNMYNFQRVRAHLLVPYREEIWLRDRSAVEHLTGTQFPRSLLYTEEQCVEIRAWMYIGAQEYWGPMLDAGYLFSPVKLYTPKSGDLGIYYRFTRLEYEL